LAEPLVIDSNVILSAILGGAAREIIFSGRFSLFAPQRTLFEVAKHLPHVAKKLDSPEQDLFRAYELLPITACQPSQYEAQAGKARLLIGGRDPNDVDVVALGLRLRCPIWTEDRDFQGLAEVQVARTRDLVAMLKAES
jgi:predicted nucleic acid-binding protein